MNGKQLRLNGKQLRRLKPTQRTSRRDRRETPRLRFGRVMISSLPTWRPSAFWSYSWQGVCDGATRQFCTEPVDGVRESQSEAAGPAP